MGTKKTRTLKPFWRCSDPLSNKAVLAHNLLYSFTTIHTVNWRLEMKKRHMIYILITGLVLMGSTGYAEENQSNLWETEFVTALQEGKAAASDSSEGLAYTPAQETVLEEAIKKAMEMKAPPCEAMKIAVDLKYSPYSTIRNIFGYGGQVDLNQLCGCATETGISKEIIAQAAAQAVTPLGTPVFSRDEITQAQCLTGLGYTPYASDTPRIDPDPKPRPISVSSPGA